MKKNSFWSGKQVLITGVHGFVGSNLAKNLINKGATVFGITKNNSSKSLLTYEDVKNYNNVNIPLNEEHKISELINDKEIKICFHLAAQVEVKKASEFPYDTFNNNINSTLALCESIRKSNYIKSTVFTSTDKVYGDVEKSQLPCLEHYVPKPNNPYEVSKLLCEKIFECYSKNYNLPVTITRSCNLYGPGQLNFTALFPSLIKTALLEEEFIPRSNGSLLRDYMYIEDWIDTLKIIVEKSYKNSNFSKVYNFGTNNPYSVKDIAKFVYDEIDNSKTHQIVNSFNSFKSKNEILYQSLDSVRSTNDFNFKAKTEIITGIKKTIEWYKKYVFK